MAAKVAAVTAEMPVGSRRAALHSRCNLNQADMVNTALQIRILRHYTRHWKPRSRTCRNKGRSTRELLVGGVVG